jgi:Repeat of unknown function (DUF5648)
MPTLRTLALAVGAIAILLAAMPHADARTAHKVQPGERKIGTLTPSVDASALVAQLAGPGVTLSNARFTGSAKAAGTFSGAAPDIGIDAGVMMSTGDVLDLQGPNNDEAKSTVLGTPGDSALELLVAPYATFDAAILQFDLVTASPTISIRYVFASEEYNEFVDSAFNDAMAIFVNGVNCANFGGRPVAVNTINGTRNATQFIDNTSGLRFTQMDGMTIALDCTAAVIPNQVNTIRIAIADVSDDIYDAAVFLAAGGVRSPGVGPVTLSDTVRVIEYYHPVFNHYFITAIPAEIANLDTGALSNDWNRTGEAFDVFVSGLAGTTPTCRNFSATFAPRSSHYYGTTPSQCAAVSLLPAWTFEGEVFNTILTSATGTCPAGTRPLYRLYNNGMSGAPNHRYTTETSVRVEMVLANWTPEGQGIGVVACVP